MGMYAAFLGERTVVPTIRDFVRSSSREETVAVRLRLTRVGGKKDPMWRVVVADQRSPRDGRVIETIGHYNAQTNPSTIVIDEDRARSWLARGAQPSDTVRKLLRIQGIETRTG
jgi:small subunit ribosomal protein S16